MPRVELARLLARVGRHAEAKEQFAQAVALGPNDAESHLEYAVFLSSTRENAQALEHYEVAVRLRPSFAVAHQYYGILLANLGRADDAVRQLREALAFDPNADLARAWLGRVLIARGMLDEGLRELAPLLKRRPAQADVSLGLAEALHLAGRHAQAIDVLKNAVAGDRQPFPHVRLLAWLLATAPEAHLRDGPLAVRLASQASRMAGRPRVDTLDTLAAALAAAGRFEEAVRVAEQAVAVARRSGYQQLAGEISTRLHLYKQDTPFRETRGARPGG
jgi:spermidine synthase